MVKPEIGRGNGHLPGGPSSALSMSGADQGGDFDDRIGQLAHSADEKRDDVAIELGVGATLEFGEGLGGGASFLVGAVAGDGVEGVGNGDDAGTQRNVFAGEPVWIAGAIEKFVMVEDHLANARERSE